MFRVTLLIGILSALFLSSGLALHAAGVMTDTSFTIELAQMDPIAGSGNPGQGVQVLNKFLGNIADLLLFIVPVIAVISLLIAGYFYIFSAGDSEKVGRAKTIIKWNIIAIIVALMSYGIVKLIAQLFT